MLFRDKVKCQEQLIEFSEMYSIFQISCIKSND